MGGEAAREGEQHVETGVVGPVQVFDDDQQRPRGRQRGRRTAPAHGRVGAAPARDRAAAAGEPSGRTRASSGTRANRSGATAVSVRRRRPLARQVRPQQVEQRRVGEDAVGLETAPLEDAHPPRGGPRPRLRHEARLADPRLARDDDRLPRPARRVQARIQRGEIGGAADDHGTDHGHVDWRRHRVGPWRRQTRTVGRREYTTPGAPDCSVEWTALLVSRRLEEDRSPDAIRESW